MSKDKKELESTTYQTMFEEVEEIVRDINSPNLDLDKMVAQVERGYSLISKMRQRLQDTKLKIDELQQKYDDGSSDLTKDSLSPADQE